MTTCLSMKTSLKKIDCVVCASPMIEKFSKSGFGYFVCSRCGHVTTWPYPSNLEIEQHYRIGFLERNYRVAIENSSIYDRTMMNLSCLLKKNMIKRGKGLAGLDLLDIGCFTGEFICHMASYGCNVWGIELQEEASKIANSKLPGRVLKGDILSDRCHLPIKQFDIVTLLGVLEHVVDPITLLKHSAEMIKPGGFLMIQTPDSLSTISVLMGRMWPPYTPVEHIHIFSRKALMTALCNRGFSNIMIKKHWKVLSITYVYNMLRTFGPELHSFFSIFYKIFPAFLKRMPIPFYGGEIVCIAQKVET